MGRIKTEDYISLQEASDYIYGLTKIRRKANTLVVWSLKGLIDRHGSKVKLRTARRLKRKYTTEIWVDEFLREVG
jgi:hypothetical protein